MTDLRVQYTTTPDGVSIAWGDGGQGPALFCCGPTPFTHVQEGYGGSLPYLHALTNSFRLITFDARGIGMSDRDVEHVSAATMLIDAEAVIAAAKIDHFIVYADGGSLFALATALRIALAYPERATHLVLEAPFQNMRELADTPIGRTAAALAELDWDVYLQTVVRVLIGFDDAASELIEHFAARVGTWVDERIGIQYVREHEVMDVSDLLPQISLPTLVTRNDPFFVPARSSQRVAAKIPGAQFRQFSDPTYVQQVDLIREFVGLSTPPAVSDAPAPPLSFRTILWTDLVGHTEMMSRLGDERGRDVLREHERITREVLKANGGTEVKTMGDGFLASFRSVTKAVESAIALQRAFADREGEPLNVRVGLNAGEPIEEDGDLFGATVILASRIAAKADGGEILVADTVRGLCSGKGFLFADRGDFVAKGIEEPVRISEVNWRE
jgi:class 3 adenylate cyclase